MKQVLKRFRLFVIAALITTLIIIAKYILHSMGWEVIEMSSLHSSMVAGTTFVIGFLLSTTMADYKESERIPADFAANIENMHEDAISFYKQYPKFDLVGYQKQLQKIAAAFAKDVRSKSKTSHLHIHRLSEHFAEMEKAGVPPNFIVKLKQQQALLTKHVMRVNYIQRITFIPSATILAWSIVVITLSLIMFTKIESLLGSTPILGGLTFILMYILLLIRVIRTPFHAEGATQDDVSLYLIDQTAEHLKRPHK